MTEVKKISGEVLFSYDESKTTLAEEISKHKDLRGADLKGADLRGANLSDADLSEANLTFANLTGADLRWADLRGANFSNADLSEAYIRNTILSGADLSNANLRGANLTGAGLFNTNLSNANLRKANLTGADLDEANLKGANLFCTSLTGADLSDAKNVPDGLPMACPEEGSFIAWKKVSDRYIIKLEVPEDAKRSSATSKKCRCSKAMVLEIIDLRTGENVAEVVNTMYALCTYTVGEMVFPDSFDENRWNECSHGIHFFIDRDDAVNYYYY